jgi:hypothetical protein
MGGGTASTQGQPAGYSPTFAPTSLPGCALWLRADIGVTTGATFTWADQSGSNDSNKNATQASSGAQPSVITNDAAFNNVTSLSLTGANSQYLRTGTWGTYLFQPSTWIVVCSSTAEGYIVDGIVSASRQAILSLAANDLAFYSGSVLQSVSAPVQSPCVIALQFNGASSAAYCNNSQTPALSSVNPGSDYVTGLTLGASEALATFMTGKIVEVYAYSRILTAPEMKMAFAYSGGRCGIAVS